MNILILGGREFLGRHIVDSCLASKHQVTLFNRGITNSDLYPELEIVSGDRELDLYKLEDRHWDVVIDTCGYSPLNLKDTAKALSKCASHYIFISSCSVYDQHPKEKITDENAQIVNLEFDENNFDPKGKDYGVCKYLSERAIENNFSGKVTHIRPGLIVGPFDSTARFPYWVKRLIDGGPTIAPSSPDFPTQFIDARDLANWCVHIAENDIKGIFNAIGPSAQRTSLGEFLEHANEILGCHAELNWIPEHFLQQHGVKCWTELPLWVFKEIEIFVSWDSSKAVEHGLKFRPIKETVLDTARWLKDENINLGSLRYTVIEPEKERDLLLKYRASL